MTILAKDLEISRTVSAALSSWSDMMKYKSLLIAATGAFGLGGD